MMASRSPRITRVEKPFSTTRSPKALAMSVASSTRRPEAPPEASPIDSDPAAERRRRALSSRRAISFRRRPSLRARRAVTPRAIQWFSRSSSLSSLRAASASASAIFSTQPSKAPKPWSRRRTCRPSSQKQVRVMCSRKARSWLTISRAARIDFSRASRASMARMSRWLVGSSSSSTSGSSAKARARAVRRTSPPDRPSADRSGSSPKACSSASARCTGAPPAAA